MTRQERDALVLRWRPLVRRMVGNELKRRPELRAVADDLEQEGYLGLLRAAETWRKGAGSTFKGWAVTWVQAFLKRARREAPNLLRPMRTEREESGWRFFETLPLDKPLGGEDGPTPAEVLPAPARDLTHLDAPRLVAALLAEEARRHPRGDKLRRARGTPSPVGVWLRWHLGEETQDALATELGVSRQRVEQMLRAAEHEVERFARGVREEAA